VFPLSVSEGENKRSNAVVSSIGGEGVGTVFMVAICIPSSGDMASSVPRGDEVGRLFDVSVSVGAMRWPGSHVFPCWKMRDPFAETVDWYEKEEI